MFSFIFIFGISCSSGRDNPTPPGMRQAKPILQEDSISAVNPPPEKRIKARHILIAHSESVNAPGNIRRNRFEARLKAEGILHQVQAGQDFKKIALKESDDPSASRGGELGVFERGAMVKEFEETAFGIKVDDVAMVETQYGFHILQRLPLEEVHLTHIVVQWKDRVKTKVKRSKAQAENRIQEARNELLNGLSPSEVAVKYSDGPFGKRGGEVGWFQKGQLNPSLEAAAFTLKTAQISSVIETKLGYHLLIRNQ